jgi:predicted nucleic acid-binding protein
MVLLDTNILVYADDPTDTHKQQRAFDIYQSLTTAGRAVLSVQCLSELFNALTRKLTPKMSPADAAHDAAHLVERVARACVVLDLTIEIVLLALQATARFQLSVWDALIWAVAKQNGLRFVLTEDLQHNQIIDGVRVLNPFHASFALSRLQ